MGGGVGGFPPRRFEEQYHCYSVAYADKADLEVRECGTVLDWTVLSLPIWDCEKPILWYGEIRGGTERDIEPHDTGGYVYFTGIAGYIFAFLTQQFDSWLSPKTERRQDFIASLCV
jgi:hypothetical protein